MIIIPSSTLIAVHLNCFLSMASTGNRSICEHCQLNIEPYLSLSTTLATLFWIKVMEHLYSSIISQLIITNPKSIIKYFGLATPRRSGEANGAYPHPTDQRLSNTLKS